MTNENRNMTAKEWATFDALPREIRHALHNGVFKTNVLDVRARYNRLRASLGPRKAARIAARTIRNVNEKLLLVSGPTAHSKASATLMWNS